ncbi:unnamed protein product [Peniophora sp. CBMAI 1063]|nr:unnamed protein product [Peniophora sp. CBMAI 1063]
MPGILTADLWPEVPLWPTKNYAELALERPEFQAWDNFTLQIDGVTGKKRKFREFLDLVADAATALGAGGLGLTAEQGFVGLMSENCMDYPVIVYALFKIGVPFSLIPSLVTPAESRTLLKLSDARTLFVSPRLLPIALEAAKETGLPESRIFVLGGHVAGRTSFSDLYHRVQSKKIPRVPYALVKEDSIAYMVFSSGTSGLPKGVLLSHKNIYYGALQIAIMLEKSATVLTPPKLDTPEGIPVALVVLPMYHTMGLHAFIIRMLFAPSTFVYLPKWNPERVAESIHKYKITSLSMVPSMAHQLATHAKLRKVNLDGILSINTGAAYLPPELRSKLAHRAKNVISLTEGYGMSECTVAAIVEPIKQLFAHIQPTPGLTGVLIPSMRARIVREDGSDAEFDEPGELLLQGGNVAMGYYKNPKATAETFDAEGWLHTGDRFKVDKIGRYFYVDRAKDTLKVSGTQVSPLEIEDTLLVHPGGFITDVAVAGVPGTRMSDEKVPRAWIVLSERGRKAGRKQVAHELEAWIKERLSRPKWLRGGIGFIDEIPKLPTGKVLRRKLQEDYAAAVAAQGGPKAQAKL